MVRRSGAAVDRRIEVSGQLGAEDRRELIVGDPLVVGLEHGTFDHVLQLADVARPVIDLQAFVRLAGEVQPAVVELTVVIEEVFGDADDVLAALAQRRQRDRDHVETIVEIEAEAPLAQRFGEIDMGGGDETEVDMVRPVAADRLYLLVLQHAQQLGLQIERHVADLVEEEGAFVRLLELAFLAAEGAGEAAFLVTEELRFQQLLGNGGAVDADERFSAALAFAVNHAGEHFLAGAGLTEEHDRRIAVLDLIDFAHRRQQRAAGTDDAMRFAQLDVTPAVAIEMSRHRADVLGAVLHGMQYRRQHRCDHAQQIDVVGIAPARIGVALGGEYADGFSLDQDRHADETDALQAAADRFGDALQKLRLIGDVGDQCRLAAAPGIAGQALFEFDGVFPGIELFAREAV